MTKIAEHNVPRRKLYLTVIFVGILSGLVNTFLDVDYSFRPALIGWFVAAVITIILIHEGIHGAVAVVLGHKPVFGIKPPFVYTTFNHKIPHGQFIFIALAPLVILDLLFGVLYAAGVLKLFSNLCFVINTLGAAGDVWITFKLIRHERGTLVQDTKTGVEVWWAEEYNGRD